MIIQLAFLGCSPSGGRSPADAAPAGDSLAAGAVVHRLSAGAGHTCAIQRDASVACWGSNVDGELGDGTGVDRPVPGPVPGLSAISISSGSYHNCALTAEGRAACWGWNSYGQVGDGSDTNRLSAFVLSSPTSVLSVAAGGYHSCAVSTDGSAACWGQNTLGQLGDGAEIDSPSPVGVFSLPVSRAVSAAGRHSCALVQDGVHDGTVQCWGATLAVDNDSGAPGDQVFPLPVPGLTDVVALAAGFDHNCALSRNGSVACWGANDSGQLGIGTTAASATPVTVAQLPPAAAIAAGYNHTCAILQDATLRCWGSNAAGQLGDGTTVDRALPVSSVSGLSQVAAVAGGSVHTCAATNDGAVYCWGSNDSGQLGDGSTTNHLTPTQVRGVRW